MYVVTGSRDCTARIWSVPATAMQLDPNGTAAPTAAPPARERVGDSEPDSESGSGSWGYIVMSILMICCVCLLVKNWKRFHWNCVCSAWKNSKVLYHSTDHESERNIVQSGFFLRGSPQCMFGSGIYFAESPKIAERKACYGSSESAIIEAEVVLGRCYQPKTADKSLSFYKLLLKGYGSVWARPAPDGPMSTYQEWVVYSKYQVRLRSVKVDGKELLSKKATRGGALSTSERGQAWT